MDATDPTGPKDFSPSPVDVIVGPGSLDQLGRRVADLGLETVLVVTDDGLVKAGHAVRVAKLLSSSEVGAIFYPKVSENPTTDDVRGGVELARRFGVDGFVALGGGSPMDCAKAINLIYTHGGELGNYAGEGKPTKPLLPLVAIPTTAGTGSEAQSFALISDPISHRKMVIGDRWPPSDGGMRPHLAILDAELTASTPRRVAALAGLDATAHAIETAGSTAQTEVSRGFSRRAWNILSTHIDAIISGDAGVSARHAMLIGAHLAGLAIEYSMLGAAHACANPLTAQFGVTHGLAVAIMLPHVIRFNAEHGDRPYRLLGMDDEALADRVAEWLRAAALSSRLSELGVANADIPSLAAEAARQWTAGFNPRPVGQGELAELYQRAMD